MRWEDERQSDNVDDLRGDSQAGGGGFGGGGGGGGLIGLLFSILPMLGLRGGIGVLVVIGLVVFGLPLLGNLTGGGSQTAPPSRSASGFQPQPAEGARTASPAGDENLRFVRAVAAFTEDTWKPIFAQEGRTYTSPRIELYSRGHDTGCGFGQSAMGPFYCPQDRKVWLDLSFFDELSGRFGAPGRFAEAYVIAHEVGHHVQTLLGTTQKIDAQRSAGSRTDANRISVRVELQADCYAGVWAKATNDRAQAQGKVFLEDGDIAGGLRAATAVGDDTLQQETQGRVAPDSFTHGTSAQRVRWFRQGFSTADIKSCDTFGPDYGSL